MARVDPLLRSLYPEPSAATTEAENPLTSLQSSQSTLENYASELLRYQSTTEESIARQAYRAVKKEMPNLAPAQLASVAKQRYTDSLKVRDEEIAKRQTMLRQALEQGGGEGYLGIFGTPEQQEAIRAGKTWRRNPEQARFALAKDLPAERQAAGVLMQLEPEERAQYEKLMAEDLYGRAPAGALETVGRVLTAPARGFAGTLEGLRSQMAELAPAEPDTEQPGAVRQFLNRAAEGVGKAITSTPLGAAVDWAAGGPTTLGDVASRTATMAAGGPIGGPLVTTAKRLLFEDEPTGDDVFSAAGKGATGLLASGAIGGVDVGDAAARVAQMARTPEMRDIVIESLKRGGKAFLGRSDDETSAFRGLQQLKEQWLRESYRQAKAELQGGSPNDVSQRASAIFENRLANDALGPFIKNPNMAQMTLELIDPAGNLLGGPLGKGVVKGIGAGAKAVGKGGALAAQGIGKILPEAAKESAAKMGQRLGDLRDAFTWLPEAKRLEKVKSGLPASHDFTGKDAAQMMRLAEAEGEASMTPLGEMFEADLRTLRELPKSKQPVLGDIIEGRGFGTGVLEMDPELRGAYQAQDRLQQKALALKEERGIGRTFKEDPATGELVLAETAAREHYMPHQVLSKKGEKALEAALAKETITKGPGETLQQATLRAKSAQMRKAPDWWFENSPRQQWEAEIKDLLPKAAKAGEVRNLVKYLDEVGFAKEFDPRIGKIAGVKIEQLQETMAKQTGVKWTPLDRELAPVLQRVTGKISEPLGSRNWLVPEPAVERFRQLVPIIGGTKNPTETAARALIDFTKNAVRPFMHAIRFGLTVLGGPIYTVNNLVGAFGLGTTAHGIRALNPKLQFSAVAGALASGGLGSKIWSRMSIPLASGKAIELGEALDFTKRIGLLDQFEMHAGLDILQKRGVTAKALDVVGNYMTPFYLPTPTKKLGTRNVNRMVENYQKLVVFLGFLEDTTDTALARALEKTSEFAGNYRRLSPAEKIVLQDGFTFYNWTRFILPHLTKQIIRNPQRFAAWAKVRGYFEREGEGQAPYGEQALPDYVAGRGFPAPAKWQPRDVSKMREHDYAAAWIEDPYSMLLGMWGQISKSPSGWVTNQLSAPANFMIELVTGRDAKTGEMLAVPSPLNPEDLASSMGLTRTLGQARGTALAKMLIQPAERMSDNLSNIYNLYWRDRDMPLERMDLQMRYKAMRTFGVLGKVMNKIAGKDVAVGSAIPGVGTSYIRALPTAARQQREKMQKLQAGTYQMGK